MNKKQWRKALYMKLYVNGTQVASRILTAAQQGALGASGTAYIGSAATQYWWNGVLDEVAVYDYALSPATVLDHSNTGKDIATY